MNEYEALKGTPIVKATGCRVGAHVFTAAVANSSQTIFSVNSFPTTGPTFDQIAVTWLYEGKKCNCGAMEWHVEETR